MHRDALDRSRVVLRASSVLKFRKQVPRSERAAGLVRTLTHHETVDTAVIIFFEALLVLGLVLAAGLLAKVLAQSKVTTRISGEAVVLVADDFANGHSETKYFVRDAKTGQAQSVQFVDGPPRTFQTGAVVTVVGTAGSPGLQASETDVQLLQPAPSIRQQMSSGAMNETSGTLSTTTALSTPQVFRQNTLVILVNDLDQAEACSSATCSASVFGATNSVQSVYAESSNHNVGYTGQVVGPFTIAARTTDACPQPWLNTLESWAGLADAQAQKAGINLSGYTEKVYVMPTTNPCGNERGYATIGGSPGLAWIFQCKDPEVFTHEMGHNLGMAHAATLTSEYGDFSDIMGPTNIGIRDLNAAHRDQFNWIPAANVVNVKASGTYSIAPLEQAPATTALPQALKIYKADTNETYYFSFRQPSGFDTILPTFNSGVYTNGVSVHRFAGALASNIHTYFLEALVDGGTFTDSVNKISVQQLSHNTGGARVQVTLGSGAPMLSPASLAFGGFKVGGHTAAQVVTLTNPSGAALAIYSVGITGANRSDFLIVSNTCGTGLAAGASCTIGVVFRPTSTGARTAYVAVGDAVGTQETSLSGTGLNPLSLPAASYAFVTQGVGTSSAAVNFTLSNTGNSSVTLSKINTVGPFAVTASTCGATLSTRASCVIGVRFSPTAVGTANGSLQVWSSASSSALAETLTGSGK